MTVATHICFTGSQAGLSANFNYNCFLLLAEKYPDTHFIFIFDDPAISVEFPLPNCTQVKVGPCIRNSLLLHYWYNFKLPGILRKYNADVFISCGEICGLRITIPQCIIIPDVNPPQSKSYLKKYRKTIFEKASKIFITNDHALQLISSQAIDHEKAKLVYHGLNAAYRPTTDEEKMKLKDTVSEGCEFFLYLSPGKKDPCLLTMLKAFSLFKKWQKSNMMLLILSQRDNKDIVPDFKNYKYKDEVKLIPYSSEENNSIIISAAYAAIYLPGKNIIADSGLEILASGTPLITIQNVESEAVYGEAACATRPDEGNISKQMILLYKNEETRSRLLEKANELLKKYSWENTASIVWKNLQEL